MKALESCQNIDNVILNVAYHLLDNYVKRNTKKKKKKEMKEKKLIIPQGASALYQQNQRTLARCRPRRKFQLKSEKVHSYIKVYEYEKEKFSVGYEQWHARESYHVHEHSTSNVVCKRLVRVCFKKVLLKCSAFPIIILRRILISSTPHE